MTSIYDEDAEGRSFERRKRKWPRSVISDLSKAMEPVRDVRLVQSQLLPRSERLSKACRSFEILG